MPSTTADAAARAALDAAAEPYVRLVLALGRHDADTVDAYYGPPTWRADEEARTPPRPLAEIASEARAASERLRALRLAAAPDPGDGRPSDEELVMLRLRRDYLAGQLAAVATRAEIVGGRRLGFDEESRALYDAVSPPQSVTALDAQLTALERLVPGEGPLAARYDRWRQGFVVPRERLDAVFRAAIAECRRRSLEHLALPAGEDFRVEYVTGKTWSGYNWYQGGFKSLIQVNTDLPITIDRAVDLACHEGYPGHHAYNALLEKHLVRERGWVEFSIYPLFSPQSLIAEGTANFGIEVAFPGEERVRFEEAVLFPLAGLDPAGARPWAEAQRALTLLSHAENDAARRYLEGAIDAAAAADWLMRYRLWPRARAEQRVRFVDQYRSYVINYNLGQDLVRRHIESRGGTADRPDVRWREFLALLASPRLPGGLAAGT